MDHKTTIRTLQKREDIGFLIMSLIMFLIGILTIVRTVYVLLNRFSYDELYGFIFDIVTTVCFIIYFVLFFLKKDGKYWVAVSFSIYNLNMFVATSYFYIVPIFTLPVSVLLFSIASRKNKHLLLYFILLFSGYFAIIYLQNNNILYFDTRWVGLVSTSDHYLFFIFFITSAVGLFALYSKNLRIKEEYGAALYELNQQKTNFFVNLAHETKTPLTLILNYLDRYMKMQNDSSVELNIVRQNLQKLALDMENYLDTEKIEQGKELYTHDKIVNFSDLLSNEVLLFTESAGRKGIKLDSSIEENIFIKAHDTSLCRVIRNLLDNGIKYTGKGGFIEVKLALCDETIHLTVTDTGIGIPAEQLDNIFKPYFQINGRKQNYQGSGMGLCITRGIIDDLQGKIEIQSTVNKGTTIRITLPLYQLKEGEKADALEVPPRFYDTVEFDIKEEEVDPDLQSILIVEDEPGILSLLKQELKGEYNLFFARNGKEALERLSEVVPDLIISDVMMDVMDGFEFINHIPEAFKSVPFIFLTARTGLDDKLKGLNRGAIDYVKKPFAIEEVRYKIQNNLEKQEQVKKKVFHKMKEFLNDKTPLKTSLSNFCLRLGITQKEKQVILLVNDGLQNKEIAFEMKIAENTVKSHLNSIFNKLNVTNRIGIVKKIKDLDLSS